MTNPYNWHFPQRNDTMFMATIESSSPFQHHSRTSSFQNSDIPGARSKQQIPEQVNRQNYSNSTYIEPIPNSHSMKNKFIESKNLRTDDIEFARPQCNGFKTNRITNPIVPRYQLPYVPPVTPEPPRPFIRDSMNISDIQTKIGNRISSNHKKEEIEGSSPMKLFRTVEAVSRLDVKDINRDGTFTSARTSCPSDPLDPTYTWRDTRQTVNKRYGNLQNKPKQLIPAVVRKPQSVDLNNSDIDGARANSFNERKYFFSRRKDYRDPLNITDIGKANASSLKKGITTGRQLNPLMPQYKYLGEFY